jgi:hypothetical protein
MCLTNVFLNLLTKCQCHIICMRHRAIVWYRVNKHWPSLPHIFIWVKYSKLPLKLHFQFTSSYTNLTKARTLFIFGRILSDVIFHHNIWYVLKFRIYALEISRWGIVYRLKMVWKIQSWNCGWFQSEHKRIKTYINERTLVSELTNSNLICNCPRRSQYFSYKYHHPMQKKAGKSHVERQTDRGQTNTVVPFGRANRNLKLSN